VREWKLQPGLELENLSAESLERPLTSVPPEAFDRAQLLSAAAEAA
jgi:hypothetical protein